MNINIRKTVISMILWSTMITLLVVSFTNVNTMSLFPAVSLRYNEPISGRDAYQLRRFSIESSANHVFWPTFWYETTAHVKSDLNSATAVCIVFSGDALLVWNADYIDGTAPGVTDGIGCAISSALAFALWGGTDVVSKVVNVDGNERIVRGVFEETQLLALMSVRDEDTRQNFSAIELSEGPPLPTRSDVIDFISRAGLSIPDVILLNRPTFLASVMFALPLMLLAFFVMVIVIKRFKKHPLALGIISFSLFLLLALTLPVLLDSLPQWIIPSRFSDFSFWNTQLTILSTDLHEHLKLTPQLRDVSYMILFYKQIGISLLSTVMALVVCFWHIITSKKQYAV
jgi:hypothetical protein